MTIENIEKLDFDVAIKLLESKLDELEKVEDMEANVGLYEDAVALKQHCEKLLAEEKENIKKIAKENNIPLSLIGIDEEEGSEASETSDTTTR
ncbi:MAG: hypothetical protein Ta2D_11600 [Rickettsiales bacterium]|nr:MAG: hypothetical protein Ta2D_11600 [Rickettsiales bacterium]